MEYTTKEAKIILQTKKGPFYTKVIELSNIEFDEFLDKLILDKQYDTILTVLAIYWDYNSEKIINFFLDNQMLDYLVRTLNVIFDFATWKKWETKFQKTTFNDKFIVDEIIKRTNRDFVISFLKGYVKHND